MTFCLCLATFRFTDDHEYLPTVMNTKPFFYRLWLPSIHCTVVCYMFVFRFILLDRFFSVFRINDFCLSLWYLQILFQKKYRVVIKNDSVFNKHRNWQTISFDYTIGEEIHILYHLNSPTFLIRGFVLRKLNLYL